MISQATAVSKHHFTDADESEDRIALSLVRSVQYTRKNLMTSLLTLCIILFVSAGLTVYQMHSGFSPAYTIISVVLLFLYVPRCVQVCARIPRELRHPRAVREGEASFPAVPCRLHQEGSRVREPLHPQGALCQ